MNNQQIKNILNILKKTYPDAKIALNYNNNWELLVSVILSAQCTDVKVNQVTSKLFKKYKNLSLQTKPLKQIATPRNEARNDSRHPTPRPAGHGMTEEQKEIQNFAFTPIKELEKNIKSTGFYRNKAKNIQGAAKMILEKYQGKIPDTMDEILKLPGVARKTANVVLGNAYNKVEGIAVDTHVLRISQRLRLVDLKKVGPAKQSAVIPAKAGIYIDNLNRFRISTTQGLDSGMTGNKPGITVDYYKDAKPEKTEQELMKVIPKQDWFKFTYQIIDHGRTICKAQNPKCDICPLNHLCPVSR